MNQLSFRNEVRDEFFRILDFWALYTKDDRYGGFFGTIDINNKPIKSEKSCVVNARILWSYSNAIRFLNENPELYPYSDRLPIYQDMASRAYNYLTERFGIMKTAGFIGT